MASLHGAMKRRAWTNCPPAPDLPHFATSSTCMSLAESLIDRFRAGKVISIHSKDGRGNYSILESIPEMCLAYAQHTLHQTKVVVYIEEEIPYHVPSRRGNLRVKEAASPYTFPELPHICFANEVEFSEFIKFGTATVAIVVKKGGIIGQHAKLMDELGKMFTKSRLEGLIVVSEDSTPQSDWRVARDIFGKHGLTVSYYEV
ncbi:hypothetical protein PMAYCL1PPCAC_19279 [Pristionchus mayeri]|uniref:Uncharacterized protein n=1 Tax=Pristionchus mayeri TaxID=1317129 RepID=A0AAN5CR50_9BILA|nr:hypothetical protein PMAYCL1PPCAC_19279 [Pristionchus mayeri]